MPKNFAVPRVHEVLSTWSRVKHKLDRSSWAHPITVCAVLRASLPAIGRTADGLKILPSGPVSATLSPRAQV